MKLQVDKIENFPEGTVKVVEHSNIRIAVFHILQGFFAISDVCTHKKVSLAKGKIEGNTVICPAHGATFDITTGMPLKLPAVQPVQTYPVHLEKEIVFVEVPDSG